MTRTLSHSLNTIAGRNNWDFKLWSAYDRDDDLMVQYLPAENFKGFGANRLAFVLKTILNAREPDVIILTHINLAIVGLIVKAINPKCKVWLVAHGIEVWRYLSKTKNRFLKRCDQIICVSNFTKEQMILRHDVEAGRCTVLNNVIDPFMPLPTVFSKPEYLLKRHRLTGDSPVIFTLARLSSCEQYKGHDHVIKVLGNITKKFPKVKYVLAGQYDHREEIRIQKLISGNKLDVEIILTGFIEDRELSDYFLLADLFVLPSKKEGFGIVFIEALANGLPVICGNEDGSIDAIYNGELGTAINPDDLTELENTITRYLENPLTVSERRELQQQCLSHFNEDIYMNKLEKLLTNVLHD